MTAHRPLALLLLLATAACGSSGNTTCDPVAQSGCEAGLVCEQVIGGAPGCFGPVVVTGRVFDLAGAAGLAGAQVVALDVDGAPASRLATTAQGPNPAAGSYTLALPVPRQAGGAPAPASVTLRADRQGYETFPSGLRTALPVSTTSAVLTSGSWVISAGTDIGLVPLVGAPAGTIAGTVALPASGAGVLLVAESAAGGEGLTAVPGRDGTFTVFNVADGTYELRAYAQGANYPPVTITVSNGTASPASAALVGSAAGTATVGGSVNFVSGRAWDFTSVLLVVASTFDPVRVRGAAPPGLKAAGIASTWSISGIPDGHYRVLAGFETDYVVRDPSDIGGTAVLEFQVQGGVPTLLDGTTSAASLESFKITGAVRLTAPLRGVDGACTSVAATALPADPAGLLSGTCASATGSPDFAWEGFSSQDFYEVTVIDDLGAVAWRARVAKSATGTVYGAAAGTSGVETTLSAPVALEPGRTYQVKVAARNDPKAGSPSGETLSVSEDLLGVFTYVPPPPPP